MQLTRERARETTRDNEYSNRGFLYRRQTDIRGEKKEALKEKEEREREGGKKWKCE